MNKSSWRWEADIGWRRLKREGSREQIENMQTDRRKKEIMQGGRYRESDVPPQTHRGVLESSLLPAPAGIIKLCLNFHRERLQEGSWRCGEQIKGVWLLCGKIRRKQKNGKGRAAGFTGRESENKKREIKYSSQDLWVPTDIFLFSCAHKPWWR